MSGRNAQVARIFRVLTLLEGAPQGLSSGELHDRLLGRGVSVSSRTIYRDLEALERAGIPIHPSEACDEKGALRWKLERTYSVGKSLVLSIRELFALYMARGVLTPLEFTPFYADLLSTFTKMEDILGTKAKGYLEDLQGDMHFEPGPRWGLGMDPDILETVRAGCAEQQLLEVVYKSANSQSITTRTLGPQFLYFAKGSLYLVAEDLGDSKVKVFACPRIQSAMMIDDAYEGARIDPEKFFQDSFGVYQSGEQAEQVEIEFSALFAPYVKERRWHATQRIVSKADGTIVMSLEAAITPELIQWVLGFGPNAKVLGPTKLQKEILKWASETVEQYEGEAA